MVGTSHDGRDLDETSEAIDTGLSFDVVDSFLVL